MILEQIEHYLRDEITKLPQNIYDLPGLTSKKSQNFLYNICKNKTVLEIGCFCGASTVAMAEGARKVYTVDNWKNIETVAVNNTFAQYISDPKQLFLNNILDYKNIELISEDIISAKALNIITNINTTNKLDVVFYDASHKYEDVLAFLMLYEGLFRNCILIVDDYNFVGVQDALSTYKKHCTKNLIKEYLINTFVEDNNNFWNGLAIQVYI